MRSRLVAALLLVAACAVLAVGGAPSRSAAADAPGSAVTVSGTGPFSDLKVTVAQTTALINQIVEVTWQGGVPTFPEHGSFYRNYLQIMQCWGDDPSGPTRDHCEFGASTDSRGGFQTATRQANYGGVVDPQETVKKDPDKPGNVFFPFTGVNGKTVAGDPNSNDFFDSFDTNEVPYARTYSDGKGKEFFQILTAQQAPGLGCGTASEVGGQRVGRRCWLVVVPRDDHEVDGSQLTGSSDQLNSSPLSATNWSHRIAIPLDFQPIGLSCPIGTPEKRTLGQEAVAEAIGRWQPTLCEDTGDVYGYSEVSDDASRRELASDTPNLVFLGRPIGPDDAQPAGHVVYAPMTLSGLGITFVVERSSPLNAKSDVKALDGTRIDQIKLTPRLVAKLLTQSYVNGVTSAATHLGTNPRTMTQDPEFLALNPAFKDLTNQLNEVLEPVGLSDAVAELWDWIAADPDAKAFLGGTPDPYGMKVNPFYGSLELPREDLPKSDPTCLVQPPYPDECTLDLHPYVNDFHDGVRQLSRGEGGSRVYDPTALPPTFKKGPPSLSGSKAGLAVGDSATASRYSLVMASLRNANGDFVQPTDASLLAAVAAMTPSDTPGVLTPHPETKAPGAYPLPLLSYAATVPSAITADQGKAYAALLRYAAGDGQVPGLVQGSLPFGYTPLPSALRAVTVASAGEIAADAGKPDPVPTASPSPASTSAATAAPSPASATTKAPVAPRKGPARRRPLHRPAPTSAAAVTPAPAPQPQTPVAASTPAAAPAIAAPSSPAPLAVSATRTPQVTSGLGRYALVLVLLVGAASALIGPALTRLPRPERRR